MRHSRFMPSTAALTPVRARWVPALIAPLIALAVAFTHLLGLIPLLEPRTANAIIYETPNGVNVSLALNEEASDLRPGGYVIYDLEANWGARGRNDMVWWVGILTDSRLIPVSATGFTHPGDFGFQAGPGSQLYGGSFLDLYGLFQLPTSGEDKWNERYEGWSGGPEDSGSSTVTFAIPWDIPVGTVISGSLRLGVGTGYDTWVSWQKESFTVGPIPTQTSMPDTTAQLGRQVTLRADVSTDASAVPRTPEGTVTFTSDGQTQKASVINGVATASMMFATPGDKPVLAFFQPPRGPVPQWLASAGMGVVGVQPGLSNPGGTTDSSAGSSDELLAFGSFGSFGSFFGPAGR